MNALPMVAFLRAVDEHGIYATEALIAAGHHPKVVLAKAEKAAQRGYTNYGVAPHRCWLEDKGRAFLATTAAHPPAPPTPPSS